MAFGRYNSFPFRFGLGVKPVRAIHHALLDRYSKVFDTDDDKLPALEAYAEAKIAGMAWIASKRVGNQLQPLKMLENLPVWEEACGLRPGLDDSDNARRNDLAGKLRGLGANAEPDIRDACSHLLGRAFVSCRYVSAGEEYAYMPGYNPGPPGLEWATNRAKVFVHVQRSGETDDEWLRLMGKLDRMLSDLLPGWMDGDWFIHDTDGTDDGFFLDISRLDYTGL